MRKLLYIFTLFVHATLLFSDGSHIKEAVEKSVYRIIVAKSNSLSTGTGFIINKEGYLITNNHVVSGYQNATLRIKNTFHDYKQNQIEVIKTYPQKDLAILKIKNYTTGEYLLLQNPKTIKEGQDTYIYGYPGGSDTVTEININNPDFFVGSQKNGEVSKLSSYTKNDGNFPLNYELIETSAAMNHGNSGGPMLSSLATVIGINTFGPNQNVQGIAWAIRVSELIKILDENHIAYTMKSDSIEQENRVDRLVYFILAGIVLTLFALFFWLVKNKNKKAPFSAKDISILVNKKLKKEQKQHQNIDNKNMTPKPPSDNPNHNDRVVQPFNDKSDSNTRVIFQILPENKGFPVIDFSRKKVITLGRSQHNDIVIDNQYVSREHLNIYLENNTVWIEDLQSANGTYLDDIKLKPHQKTKLNKHQKLIIGSNNVIYKI